MEYIGLQAWLDAYHGSHQSNYIKWSELDGRAGSIQAAFSLEYVHNRFTATNILINGINGLMPNLDLVSVATKLSSKQRIPLRINDQAHNFYYGRTVMRQNFFGLIKAIYNQASGSPNGLHGLFLPFQIPAVTLSGHSDASDAESLTLLPLMRMMEGALRSVNNLQERFHQSFYFYLLPNLTRYISIGVYMPPFLVLVGSLLIHLARLIWVESKSTLHQLPSLLAVSAHAWLSGLFAFAYAVPITTWVLAASPESRVGEVAPSLLLPVALGLFYPGAVTLPIISRTTKESLVGYGVHWLSAKIVLSIEWLLFLACLSSVNISLSFVLSVLVVPVMLFVAAEASRVRRLLSVVLLWLISPFSVATAALFAKAYHDALPAHFSAANAVFPLDLAYASVALERMNWKTGADAFMRHMLEKDLFGSSTWLIGCALYGSIWLQTWLAFCNSVVPVAAVASAKKQKTD